VHLPRVADGPLRAPVAHRTGQPRPRPAQIRRHARPSLRWSERWSRPDASRRWCVSDHDGGHGPL